MNQLGRLELIRESLVAVVGEMRANIIRASYSSIIYEGHDFSCALLTADGRLLAQGDADNPIHIFAVPYSTAEILKTFAGDIHEGDAEIVNIRLVATGVVDKPELDFVPEAAGDPLVEHRKVWFGGWQDTPVLDRARMAAGHRFEGPAIVEEAGGTTVVPAGWKVEVDASGALLCEAAGSN